MHIGSHTSLRGLAAVSVLWGHYTDVFARDVAGMNFFLPHTHLGVDLFFILSGFVLYHVYANYFVAGVTAGRWALFQRQRLIRVFPLHLATLLAVIILTRFDLPAEGAKQLALHLTLTHAWGMTDVFVFNPPSWSISAEFAAYLVFPFAALVVARRAGRVALAALVFGFGVVLWRLGDGSLDLADIGQQNAVLRVAVCFPMGVLLAWAVRAHTPLSDRRASTLQAVGLLAGVLCLGLGLPEMAMLAVFALLVVATAQDTGWLSLILGWRPLRQLGTICYGVYLLQWPVMLLMFNLEPFLTPNLPGLWMDLVRLVIVLGVTLAAASLSWRWFEAPMVALGRRNMDAREAPALP